MRIFPIGCEVIFTRPDDPWKGQIGTIKGEPSENGRYLVEVGNTTKLRHADDMCEASQYMKEKATQNNYLMLLHDHSVIIDTETTGLDGDAEICEISIIDANGNTLLDTFVKPSKQIPDEAIAIHGISNEMVADAPTFTELNDQIKSSLAGKDIIVYNAQYDMRILIQAAHHAGVDTEFYQKIAPKARCAMLAYSQWYNELGNYNKPKWHKLTVACEQQQIDTSAITAHRANADCQMTLMLIKNCKYKHGAIKMQTPDTQQITDLSNLDINNLVKFTQSLIEFDNTDLIAQANQVVAKYKDLVITEDDLAEMKIVRADLNKIVKGLDDQRKNIKKEYNAPLTEFENKIKEVTTVISSTIANIDNQTIIFEENRKKAKHDEVMVIMADMLNDVDLPPEYLAKVVFREEYYQKTMVNKKLKDSIQEQINTQVNLYNGWKAEQELREQLIKNREMQIAMLNTQYNANGTYSMFTIETHTDEQVVAKYEANHQRKLEQARLKKERQDAEDAKKQAVTEAQNVQRQSTDVGKPLESQPSVVEENQSVLQSENQSKNIVAEESKEINTFSKTSVTKTFTITIDAGDAATSTEAMATVEKRLAEMSHNFSTKYGIKMEISTEKKTYKYMLEVEKECRDNSYSTVIEFECPATEENIEKWLKSEDDTYDPEYHSYSYYLID